MKEFLGIVPLSKKIAQAEAVVTKKAVNVFESLEENGQVRFGKTAILYGLDRENFSIVGDGLRIGRNRILRGVVTIGRVENEGQACWKITSVAGAMQYKEQDVSNNLFKELQGKLRLKVLEQFVK